MSSGQRAKVNPALYAMIIEELVQGPSGHRDIAEVTGLQPCTVQAYLAALHKRKLIHIVEYQTDIMGRRMRRAPIYAFGEGRDLPHKPVAKRILNKRWRDGRAIKLVERTIIKGEQQSLDRQPLSCTIP